MKQWSMTDAGLMRSENQDAFAVWHMNDYTVAVVCDGMGGTLGGQIASRIAVDTFQQELMRILQPEMHETQIAQTALFSVSRANSAIHKAAEAEPIYEKMGTTLVCAVCRHDLVLVCNIGDSRAYLINDNGIKRISRDHSLVETMVERGEITAEEARSHPNRNLITRALGSDEIANADTFPLTWEENDFILLCTDGLVNTLTDEEILFEVLHGGDLDSCMERFLSLAKRRGAPDNLTAVLLQNTGKEMA